MVKTAESLHQAGFKAGYQAAQRDSLKPIREAYALGQAVGSFEALMNLKESPNDKEETSNNRDERGRDCDSTMERVETGTSEDFERDGWYLHGFNKIRPGGLFNTDFINVEDGNGLRSIVAVKFVDWSEVKYWRFQNEETTKESIDWEEEGWSGLFFRANTDEFKKTLELIGPNGWCQAIRFDNHINYGRAKDIDWKRVKVFRYGLNVQQSIEDEKSDAEKRFEESIASL